MNTPLRPVSALLGAAALTVLAAAPALADHGHGDGHRDYHATGSTGALTPIKHVVVIFQENVSFDHYVATYPHASGELPQGPHGPGRARGLFGSAGRADLHRQYHKPPGEDPRVERHRALAGSLSGMFDFGRRHEGLRRLFLDPATGEVAANAGEGLVPRGLYFSWRNLCKTSTMGARRWETTNTALIQTSSLPSLQPSDNTK